VSPRLAEEAELRLESGGPAYRLMQRLGVIKGEGPSIGRRICCFLIVTWVPLLIFSISEGRALGTTPRESFLLDFATYARFFLTVPLFFAADLLIGPRLRAAGLNFIRAGFVRPEDYAAVDAAVSRIQRLREALLPELVMVGLAVFGAWFFAVENWSGISGPTWNSLIMDGTARLSLAGAWDHFVAIPILQFFGLRWIWRIAIWTHFLYEISRLKLDLVPTHADQRAGLGFLGNAHISLAIFPFALSCVFSADVAFRIYFEAAQIGAFKSLFIAYLVIAEFICLGPLLTLAPAMSRARRRALQQYSALVNDHNREFHKKWVSDSWSADQQLLGNPDMSSLIDLGSSFQVVRQMRSFPFTERQLLLIAVIASVPMMPLVLLEMPVGELLRILAGAVF